MDEQKDSMNNKAEHVINKGEDVVKEQYDNAREATRGFQFSKLFQGRLDSLNYSYYVIVSSLLLALITAAMPALGALALIVFGVVGMGVSTRRLHDINTTGWASLLLLIPFINIFGIIYLCLKHGDEGPNAYGEPSHKPDVFHAILNT